MRVIEIQKPCGADDVPLLCWSSADCRCWAGNRKSVSEPVNGAINSHKQADAARGFVYEGRAARTEQLCCLSWFKPMPDALIV